MMHAIQIGSDNLEFDCLLLVDRQHCRMARIFFDWSSELWCSRIANRSTRLPTVKNKAIRLCPIVERRERVLIRMVP